MMGGTERGGSSYEAAVARRVVVVEGVVIRGRTVDDASSTPLWDVRTNGGSTRRAVGALLAVMGISTAASAAGRDNRFPINFVKTANILDG